MQKQVDAKKEARVHAAKGTEFDNGRAKKRFYDRLFLEHSGPNSVSVTTEKGLLVEGRIVKNPVPYIMIGRPEERMVLEGKLLKPIEIETPKELVTIYGDGSMGREPRLLRVEGVTLEEALMLVTEMAIERGLSGSRVKPEHEKPIHRLAACFARSVEPDSFMFFAGSSDPIFTKEKLGQDVVGGAIRKLIDTEDIVTGCFMAAAMSGTASCTPNLSRIIIGDCKRSPTEVHGGKEIGVYIRYHESSGIGGWGRDSYYEMGTFHMPLFIETLNELASRGTADRIRLRKKLCLETRVSNPHKHNTTVAIKKIYLEEHGSWWKGVLRIFGIDREATASTDACNE